MKEGQDYSYTEYRKKSKKHLVVIPTINEGQRLISLLERMLEIGIMNDFDVIIGDGGSDDGSTEDEVLSSFKLVGICHLVGSGPSLSTQLQAAYAHAIDNNYSGVITIDGNNKDDPAPIFEFSKLLEEGYDYVQASRFIKGGFHSGTPLSRLLAVRLIHAPILSLASGHLWTDTTQGFRAYSPELLENKDLNVFDPNLKDYRLLFQITAKAPRLGMKCIESPTSRIYPKGSSVPTKISGLRSWAALLNQLLSVVFSK